jgi:hypothetical protein
MKTGSALGKIGGQALLFTDKVKDNQSDAGHAKYQESEHYQHSDVLSLGDEAVWIGFASGAGEKHDDK